MATLPEIDNYITEIKQYNIHNPNNPMDVPSELDDFLKTQYRTCNVRNIANNKRKSGYFSRAIGATACGTALVALASVPYCAIILTGETNIARVSVATPVEVRTMAADTEGQSQQQQQKQKQKQQQQKQKEKVTIDKPKRPSTHLRTETEVKPKKPM